MNGLRQRVWRLLGATDQDDLLRSGALVFVANAGAVALAFAAQAGVARLIGADPFGRFAVALNIIVLLAAFARFGLESATLRFVPACRARNAGAELAAFLAFSGRLVVTLGAALGLGALAAAAWLGGDPRVAVLVAVTLPVMAWVELNGARLQADGRAVRYQVVYGLVRPLLLLGGTAVGIAVLGGGDAATALTANLVAVAAVGVVVTREARVVQPVEPPAATADERRRWLTVAAPMFMIGVAQLSLARLDTLIAALFVDAREVALYAAASQVAIVVSFGIHAINTVVAPRIAAAYATGDRARMQALVRTSARAVFVYTVPVFAVVLLWGDRILGLFGPEFVAGHGLLVILACGHAMIAVCGSVGFLLTMTDHQREAAVVIVGTAIASALLAYGFGRMVGVAGVAAGAALAVAFRSLVLSILVHRRLGVSATAF